MSKRRSFTAIALILFALFLFVFVLVASASPWGPGVPTQRALRWVRQPLVPLLVPGVPESFGAQGQGTISEAVSTGTLVLCADGLLHPVCPTSGPAPTVAVTPWPTLDGGTPCWDGLQHAVCPTPVARP